MKQYPKASPMKPTLLSILFVAVLTLSGCGPAALPNPSSRAVTDADVIGRWRYLGDYRTTTVEIEFTPDHKFEQTVMGPGGATKTQHGTWALERSFLKLHDVLLNQSVSNFSLSAWNPKTCSWWFTDERGRLELYGGERSDDPDQCSPLERIRVSGGPSGGKSAVSNP